MLYNLTDKDIPHENCFSGQPTMKNADLWVIPASITTLYILKYKWLNIFEKSSCIKDKKHFTFQMLRDCISLAFLGLRYTSKHLELALNPSNLRSNASIRNVGLEKFGSKDVFDLNIIVDKLTADISITVSFFGNHELAVYGCAVACEYIVELTSSDKIKKFPIHSTNPVTPIFYMSSNKTHLKTIGESEFIKHAKKNGIKSHQVALEVHHFKLSPKFWLAVVVLVVSFHVIILKMIYNECRKERTGCRRRGPYNT